MFAPCATGALNLAGPNAGTVAWLQLSVPQVVAAWELWGSPGQRGSICPAVSTPLPHVLWGSGVGCSHPSIVGLFCRRR